MAFGAAAVGGRVGGLGRQRCAFRARADELDVVLICRGGGSRTDLAWSDIDVVVPHQANKRIIDATANRMGLEHSKVMMNIERYGNTTSATLPLLLHDYEKQLKKGDKLVFAAFGGGFTWGAIYLTWAYDS